VHLDVVHISAGHKRRSAGQAQRAVAVGIFKNGASCGQPLHVGSLYRLVTVNAADKRIVFIRHKNQKIHHTIMMEAFSKSNIDYTFVPPRRAKITIVSLSRLVWSSAVDGLIYRFVKINK